MKCIANQIKDEKKEQRIPLKCVYFGATHNDNVDGVDDRAKWAPNGKRCEIKMNKWLRVLSSPRQSILSDKNTKRVYDIDCRRMPNDMQPNRAETNEWKIGKYYGKSFNSLKMFTWRMSSSNSTTLIHGMIPIVCTLLRSTPSARQFPFFRYFVFIYLAAWTRWFEFMNSFIHWII